MLITVIIKPVFTGRIGLREHKKVDSCLFQAKKFCQPLLINHVTEFLFSLRVAQTNSPSEKRALVYNPAT